MPPKNGFLEVVDIPSSMKANKSFDMKVKTSFELKPPSERLHARLKVMRLANGTNPFNQVGHISHSNGVYTFHDNVLHPDAAGQTIRVGIELYIDADIVEKDILIGVAAKDIKVSAG